MDATTDLLAGSHPGAVPAPREHLTPGPGGVRAQPWPRLAVTSLAVTSLEARGTARARDPGAAVKSRADDAGPDVRRMLLCAACRHVVTDDRQRIQMADRHEHVCTNPYGFAFRIGCFREAPGCLGVGPLDSAFSWFPGFTWQLALCRGCHGHLGWIFRAGAERFHGLILDRLVEDPP